MQKPLPPQTPRALNPPANVTEPYAFFDSVGEHPLQPLDAALNLRTAWWMADAALLAYSTPTAIDAAFTTGGMVADVTHFNGVHTTEAYVASLPDAIVLAFRGTQLDDFWSSVLDFLIDAKLFPVPDASGHLVHAGFQVALDEVWTAVEQHLRREQARRPRPLWVTGHSLGAALATLAANRLSAEASLRLQGGYTFGSPRVGETRFGQAIGVPLYRFRNDSDLVPLLPLGLLFRHVGHPQFFDGGGHLHRNLTTSAEALLDPFAPLMSAREAMTLRQGIGSGTSLELPLPGFLADHAPINYSILAWNCYDASLARASAPGAAATG
jgi:triacylglycerol lipase